jgi:hypothetical protein
MSMNLYGLREARSLIAADRKAIAAEFPRSKQPYVRGMRDALKALDNRIVLRMEELTKKAEPR